MGGTVHTQVRVYYLLCALDYTCLHYIKHVDSQCNNALNTTHNINTTAHSPQRITDSEKYLIN